MSWFTFLFFSKKMPAPLRGEIVRQIGDALRKKKSAIGQLVSKSMTYNCDL